MEEVAPIISIFMFISGSLSTGRLRRQKKLKKKFVGTPHTPAKDFVLCTPIFLAAYGSLKDFFGDTPIPGKGCASALPLVTRRQKLEEKWGSMYWANCFHWGK